MGKTKTSKVMNLAELISLAKARYGFEVASATSFDDENLVKSEYAKFIQSNKVTKAISRGFSIRAIHPVSK